jgi:glycine cleavage system H protein
MQIEAGKMMGTVESVKSVSELIAPVSGQVMEVNVALIDQPEMLNQDPEGAGWMLKVRLIAPEELSSLLDAAGYAAFLSGGG